MATHQKIEPAFLRKIRSFVRRDSRITDTQKLAIELLFPKFGIPFQNELIDFKKLFERDAPTILEIGFGSGHSLLETAIANPATNFIGIETHQPGVGSLLLGISRHQLTNLKVFYADAVEVLKNGIANKSLQAIQIFFPDPWPKRKHHKRRLIQPEFVELLVSKLIPTGEIHLATDWEHYAHHMMLVLSSNQSLQNVSGTNQYAVRSNGRPIITKFEERGRESGRVIWELQFIRR